MKKRNIIVIVIMVLSVIGLSLMPDTLLAAKCASKDGEDNMSIIDCGGAKGQAAIISVIKSAIKILTVGVGVLAVGAVIAGAILYSMSGSNPEYMKKAKTIWLNTIIGLVVFAFFAAIANFIIPGGVIG